MSYNEPIINMKIHKTISPQTMEIIALIQANRLMILRELYQCRNNVCGCDIVRDLNIPKDLLSYHIKWLRETGYISETKCGRRKNYEINQNKLDFVREVLKITKVIK